jgi:D-alanine-D-alanine ligase
MDSCKVGWADDLNFPLFVKPLNEDASIGIDRDSVVHNVKELMEKISYIQTELKASALIEEFIEGREIYIGVMAMTNRKRCPFRVGFFEVGRYSESPPEREESLIKRTRDFPTDIPEPVCKRIQEAAVQVFKALKLRDYGRVDMRLRQVTPLPPEKKPAGEAEPATGMETAATEFDNWELYIIEVNPNPYLDKKSELAMAAQKHGQLAQTVENHRTGNGA